MPSGFKTTKTFTLPRGVLPLAITVAVGVVGWFSYCVTTNFKKAHDQGNIIAQKIEAQTGHKTNVIMANGATPQDPQDPEKEALRKQVEDLQREKAALEAKADTAIVVDPNANQIGKILKPGQHAVLNQNGEQVVYAANDATEAAKTGNPNAQSVVHYRGMEDINRLNASINQQMQKRTYFGVDADSNAVTHGTLCIECSSWRVAADGVRRQQVEEKKDYVVLNGPSATAAVKHTLTAFQNFKSTQKSQNLLVGQIDVVYLPPQNQQELVATAGGPPIEKFRAIAYDVDPQVPNAHKMMVAGAKTIQNLIPKSEGGPAINFDQATQAAGVHLYAPKPSQPVSVTP